MPRLVIAEKPSVARDLARVLGATERQNGYSQGNGWLVTWCIGHLVELCEPHEYNADWKRWSLHTLPMVPEAFRLRPISRTQQQFQIVRKLLTRKDVTSVVNACDAGREGELIFRYVYYISGCTRPIERLWVSSMTDEAITQGFANLRPGTSYDRLWDAARCRSEADWLVGLNATRAMTLRTRQLMGRGQEAPLLSVGRVQTPCLAMLVHRENTIRNFVPQDYWQILGHFLAEAGDYSGQWYRLEKAAGQGDEKAERIDRFDKEEDAVALIERLQGANGVVQQVEKKKVSEKPPLLFDLTRLQRTANKRFGFSAAHTLELAQSLYEKHKLLTYPRTDSCHLSNDLIAQMPSVLRAVNIDVYAPFAQWVLALPKIPAPKRVFNDAKVSDHHAIIPTERTPQLQRLSSDEARIYDLVVRRFLAVFFPDAVFEKTSVITLIADQTFQTKGRVIVDRGWREVIGLPDHVGGSKKPDPSKEQEGAEEEDDEVHGILPPLKKGDPVSVKELELQAKKTKPPPRYTEATLLGAMEGAGRTLDDEELQEAMKDSGLGTPATRASIIETILQRGFVERQGKSMIPTPKGMQLIASIPIESLKSPELTGVWEARMTRISRGEASAQEFQAQVRAYLDEIITSIKYAPVGDLSGFLQDSQPPPPPAASQSSSSGSSRSRSSSTSADKGGNTTTKTRRSSKAEKANTSASQASSSPKASTSKRTSSKTDAPKTTRKKADGSATKTTRSRKAASNPSESTPMQSNNAPVAQTERSTSTRTRNQTQPETSPSPARSAPRAPASRPPASSAPASATAASAPVTSSAKHQTQAQMQGSLGFCPRCQTGLIIWGKRAWGCDRWREGCQTTIPYQVDGYELTVKDALALLKGQTVGPLEQLQTAQGTQYTGTLRLQSTPEASFVKAERQS